MTEFWEREYPWPDAPMPKRGSWAGYNHQRVLDLGNGWRASMVTEVSWDAVMADDVMLSTLKVWPHIPGEVEVGFMRSDGLHYLALDWDGERIVGVRVPDSREEDECDSVARHLTLDQLDQLLPLMAAL